MGHHMNSKQQQYGLISMVLAKTDLTNVCIHQDYSLRDFDDSLSSKLDMELTPFLLHSIF